MRFASASIILSRVMALDPLEILGFGNCSMDTGLT
jgi:hypothetical protein